MVIINASGTFQGPQVSKVQYRRVLSYIEDGKREGATLSFGGMPYKGVNGKGFYVELTVFTDVKDNMKIFREEVFGPLATVSPSQPRMRLWKGPMKPFTV